MIKRLLKKNPLSRRMTILILILVLVFGGLLGYNIARDVMIARYFSHFEVARVSVSSATAHSEDWQPVLQTVGTFVATQGIDINAQIGGVVKEIDFESGQMVKKGDLLLVLNDSVEQALLKSNLASLVLQQLNFQRQISLIKTGSTSTSDRDKARADLDGASAAVEQEKAYIAQKHIVAPFDGKLGIRQVSLGQYIVPGQTNIVTLESLDPLYLQFYLPEQNVTKLYVGQPIQFMVDSLPGKSFSGKVSALDAKVETDTHNVLIQALVNNEKSSNDLWAFVPGMFAKVDILLSQKKNAIVVPLTAVTYTLYGDSVYVIKEDPNDKDKSGKPYLKVYRQFVKTGEKKGDQVVILEGLKAGDKVVIAGQIKLHDGTAVKVNNSIVLSEKPAADSGQ